MGIPPLCHFATSPCQPVGPDIDPGLFHPSPAAALAASMRNPNPHGSKTRPRACWIPKPMWNKAGSSFTAAFVECFLEQLYFFLGVLIELLQEDLEIAANRVEALLVGW